MLSTEIQTIDCLILFDALTARYVMNVHIEQNSNDEQTGRCAQLLD